MAKFKFQTKVYLSYDWGSVDTQGEIELNDDEIDTIIGLMRKDRTTMDYRELKLEEADPQLYEKIDKAYHEVAYEAEGHSILMGGREYPLDGFEFDVVELILYCRDNCGYHKCSKGDKILHSDVCDFNIWLDRYVENLKFDDALEFLEEHTYLGINIEDKDIIGADYSCNLPEKLIKIEKGWKSRK